MTSSNPQEKPVLLWIYTENPEETLDAATWLETSKALQDMGWQVFLIAEGMVEDSKSGWKNIQGMDVYTIERPDIYLFGQLLFHRQAVQFMLQQNVHVNVIMFHEMSALWLFILRLLRPFWRNRPYFVMDVRTLYMTRKDHQSLKDRVRRLYYAMTDRLAPLWIDGQLAITTRLADAVHINRDKLWGIWPSGVTPQPFTDAAQGRTFPSAGDPIKIIYIGSLHYARNLMALAKAVTEAQSQGMNFELMMIGAGTEADDLTAYASDKAYIDCLPSVPHTEIPAILAKAHIGVLPFPDELKFRVSSPIKLFEYMASGLVIMASRIVCHTDVITDETCVFWVEGQTEAALFTSLEEIWQSRDTLASKSDAALALSAKWTWHESARKLNNALEKGIGKQGSVHFSGQSQAELESP
ncbi:MAG: glycosyltransferase [Aggregatilineales bacterium]